MRKQALQIEHKYKNRVVGVHLVDGKRALTVVGSSPTADIRVLGDDISGVHAAFEFSEGAWTLSDLGSEAGTWVNKKPIIETKIEFATVIHLGSHQLKATPHTLERELFTKPLAESEGAVTFHQVVILRKGLLHQSLLLDKNETFNCEWADIGPLPAPQDHEWKIQESGIYTVKQRLTRADQLKETIGDAIGEDWKRPEPVIAAFLIVFLIFGMMFLMPQKPDDQMKTLTPELQNQYTRLILDGQRVRSKKAIAEKMRKNLSRQAQTHPVQNATGGDVAAKSPSATKAPPGAKVILSLKNAGLGALIGRVAARAAKNAQLVQTAGVSAENAKAGPALGTGGGSALDKLGGGGGGSGEKSQHIGGLATAGKGGGTNAYKGTGSLAVGNIGSADVGVLEEESEVDGGLDKEAIARVIRQQLGQIRYCYERQLSANPDLYGKILIKFTIGAAGSVVAQTIGNTSLNNAMVEGCILRRIAGWQFPTPKGGTSVLVTYPFLFKSTR